MLKRIVSGIMLTSLLICMLIFAFNIQPANASGTIYIRADGSIEPSTAPISTVDNITYIFADDIYDSIVVERDNIVVDGTGYTVQGTGLSESKGISLSGIENVTVRDTQIKNFWNGIVIYDSSSNNISGNNIANNNDGIYLELSAHNSISGNNITANSYGISLWGSASNSISGNNVTANNGFGIELLYSFENSISGNNVANNGFGIELFYFSGNSISENNVTANDYMGIWLLGSSDNSISGNNLANNGYGIWLLGSASNSISGNNVTANSYGGIYLYDSLDNSISGNNVANNAYGIWLEYSLNNIIYHNNFIDNGEQVDNYYSTNVWDDGYPSGGNYWSDHVTVDDYSGIYQDEPGSDGIVDEPYIIDDANRDNYPLVEPWSPVVSATLDTDPDTLNLKSKGLWTTAYIELPEEYNPEDIDATTILLNETIPPVLDPKYDFVANSTEYLVDHDGDGVLERMVKFNRTEVASWVYVDLGIEYGDVALTITGQLFDGTPFEGTNIIKVLFPGDADDDGDVDTNDFYIFSGCYGMSIENPSHNPLADFNEDGCINSEDFYILSGNYGKTAV